MRKKIYSLIILAVFLFFSASALMVLIYVKHGKQRDLPVFNDVKDFHLTSSEGKPFALSDLNGRVWVADFVFTSCGGICPLMTKNMASLHRSFALEKNVSFISISVNPDYDTPAILEEYGQRFHADFDRWHFLTGKIEEIKDLAVKSFKLGSVEEPVFHSAYFVLVDRKQQIRGYYDGTNDGEIQKLFKDMALLLKSSKR